jgi:excisionase family DNA binding protein
MTNHKSKLAAAAKRAATTEKMRTQGYLAVAEVAAKLDIHIGSVYRWVSDGDVTGVKVGGKSYISRTSLIEKIGLPTARAFGFTLPEIAVEVEDV